MVAESTSIHVPVLLQICQVTLIMVSPNFIETKLFH